MIDLLISLLLLWPRPGLFVQTASAPNAGVGTVRGRVLREAGRPLPRARVQIIPVGPGTRAVGQAAEDGSFQFDVVPGRYRLSAAKPGYLALEFGQRRPFERGEIIDVANGATRDGITIALPRPGAVEGHVADENGDPLDRVSVQAFEVRFLNGQRRLVPAEGVGTRLTDDRGKFRLYGLPPGRYVIGATVGQVGTSDLAGYATTFFPGTNAANNASPIVLGLSETRPGIDFALVPVKTARITGTLIDSKGQSGGSLTLMPSRRSGGVASAVGARIDNGAFEFANVPPGEYVIQAMRGRADPNAEGEFVSQLVTVNGVDISGLTLRTSPGSRIAGRLVFEGGGDVLPVSLIAEPVDLDRAPEGDGQRARARVDLDTGAFVLAGVNGPRVLRVREAPAGWILKSVLRAGRDVIDTPLEFGTERESIDDLEVVMTRTVTELSGTVTDASGKAVPDTSVIAFGTDRDTWSPQSRFLVRVRSEADGTFRLTGLPAGSYYLAARDNVRGDDWQDPQLLDTLSGRAMRVTLAEGEKRVVVMRMSTPNN